MRRPTNPHSRFVRFAKIVFPLLALALLSTLFLFSKTINLEDAIPISDIDVDQIARDQVLSNPRYASVTRDGVEVTVTAERAVPDDGDSNRLDATAIRADLKTQAGLSYVIEADRGTYNDTDKQLDLSGGVVISSSDGYALTTNGLSANLNDTRLTSDAIRGDSPFGNIRAGQMNLISDADTQLLVFKKGVRLLYLPQG